MSKIILLVAPDGTLSARDFQPRRFAAALRHSLRKDWKTSKRALVRSVAADPDLLTAAISFLELTRQALAERIAATEAEINEIYDLASSEKQRDFTPEEVARLDQLEPLAERLDAGLESLSSLPPDEWLRKADKAGFAGMVKLFKMFLKTPVSPGWQCYDAQRDTAAGQAVHLLRRMSDLAIDRLKVKFNFGSDLTPLSATTALTPEQLNSAASEIGLKIRFEPLPAPKPARGEKEPSKKPSGKEPESDKKGAKKKASAKEAKKASVKGPERKPADKADKRPAAAKGSGKKTPRAADRKAARPAGGAAKKAAQAPVAKPVATKAEKQAIKRAKAPKKKAAAAGKAPAK